MKDFNWDVQSCCGTHRQARVELADNRVIIVQGNDEEGYVVMNTVDGLLDTASENGGIWRGVSFDALADLIDRLTS